MIYHKSHDLTTNSHVGWGALATGQKGWRVGVVGPKGLLCSGAEIGGVGGADGVHEKVHQQADPLGLVGLNGEALVTESLAQRGKLRQTVK